jgi:hypothetical protein
MKRKYEVLKFWPFAIFAGIIIYFFIHGQIIERKFYRSKINSIIIDSDFSQHVIEYFLKDGLQIDERQHNYTLEKGEMDVNVGDSIVKQANSFDFDVYKKDGAGDYQFYYRYNLETEYSK